MVRKHSLAMIASAAALVLFSSACSSDSEPVSTTSSTTPSSAVATSSQAPATGQPAPPANGGTGNAAPTRTVTQTPAPTHTATHPATTKPQAPTTSDPYDIRCTGPDQGSICTNPNHGAGDNPDENGTRPTTTTKVEDDDPGGHACTTGTGAKGTYTYDDANSTWVCKAG